MPRRPVSCRQSLFSMLACLVLLAGCSASTPAPETAAATPSASEPHRSSILRLTQAEAEAWLDEGRSFLAVTSSDSCGACGPYLDKLEPLVAANPDWPIVVFHDFDEDWLDAHLSGHQVWPTTVYFESGQVVDKARGALDADTLLAFATRNFAVDDSAVRPPRTCQERALAIVEAAETDVERHQLRIKEHFACSTMDDAGVELTDTWQQVTLDELAPMLENAPAAPSLVWLQDKACTVELLPVVPGQRDTFDALGVAFCGEEGTPMIFATGGPASD